LKHSSFRLPEDLASDAHKFCDEHGISWTSFLRSAVRNELRRKEVAEMEKRLNATLATFGKRIDRAASENRAGFALFLALTRELLSHIYTDEAQANEQLERLLGVAQATYSGIAGEFLGGDTNGHGR
jgi:hypothetical protein